MTLLHITLHYTTLITPQIQLQLHYTNYTTPQLQLHYTTATSTAALHHATSSSCGWGDRCNHCNHSRNTTPTTFGSVSGFALPPAIHTTNLSYWLLASYSETSATALCRTTGTIVAMFTCSLPHLRGETSTPPGSLGTLKWCERLRVVEQISTNQFLVCLCLCQDSIPLALYSVSLHCKQHSKRRISYLLLNACKWANALVPPTPHRGSWCKGWGALVIDNSTTRIFLW